ncbi:hypothetical protein ACW73L_07325 [Methylolobus aquaticus]
MEVETMMFLVAGRLTAITTSLFMACAPQAATMVPADGLRVLSYDGVEVTDATGAPIGRNGDGRVSLLINGRAYAFSAGDGGYMPSGEVYYSKSDCFGDAYLQVTPPPTPSIHADYAVLDDEISTVLFARRTEKVRRAVILSSWSAHPTPACRPYFAGTGTVVYWLKPATKLTDLRSLLSYVPPFRMAVKTSPFTGR